MFLLSLIFDALLVYCLLGPFQIILQLLLEFGVILHMPVLLVLCIPHQLLLECGCLLPVFVLLVVHIPCHIFDPKSMPIQGYCLMAAPLIFKFSAGPPALISHFCCVTSFRFQPLLL